MLQLVRARSLYARTFWIEGETDRALQEIELALEEAQAYGNPVCLAIVLTHGAGVFLWSGDFDRAQELATELHRITSSNGLPAFEALAIGIKGEVHLLNGRLEEAEALLNEALTRADAQMHANTATTIAAAQAECAFRAGRQREALDLIDRAIARATETGERFQFSELMRLKATFIIPTNAELATETFRAAISTAHQQGALAFKLKAALSFRDALLPGTEDEAHAAVTEAYRAIGLDDAMEAADRPSVPAA
jgi:tetratricopeptide (TPR) repeat protein